MSKYVHEVNLGTEPTLGYRVRRHQGHGVAELRLVIDDLGDELFLGKSQVKFFRSEKQKRGERTLGFEVLKELEAIGGIGLNYSVLDCLRVHTELWPKKLWPLSGNRCSFEAPTVYFPGTVFAPGDEPLPKERCEDEDWVCGLTWNIACGFVISSAILSCNWGHIGPGGQPPEFKDFAGSIAYIDKV